jgi:hypothetical protein
VSRLRNVATKNQRLFRCHCCESGNPDLPLNLRLSQAGGEEGPGFRVALAIASLPGMTFEFVCKLQSHKTRYCTGAVESIRFFGVG